MQQPLSNRWLNPDLLRDGSGAIAGTHAAFINELEQRHPTPVTRPRRVRDESKRRKLRQGLIFGFIALLLLGGIAFSYLAWSDTSDRYRERDALVAATASAEREAARRSTPAEHRHAPGSSTTNTTAASALTPEDLTTNSPADLAQKVAQRDRRRDEVFALRLQNARLHERIAQLQASLNDGDTDTGNG